ncbi:hypothetical protein GCM10009718_14610 [Isoptericola halotolerans]|uniref:A-factor biosynthesis hotdog domain-containing protein n=1 Tax=Isoptericola halotolerans TaxID=300560 RepID=A0ABX1ZYD2_9MICO|nr:hypothetical protein [Isoptericola halotolerans]NOV95617.1 hypothetical protein [Isoptericola halotolerans]
MSDGAGSGSDGVHVGDAAAAGTDAWHLAVRISSQPGLTTAAPVPVLVGLEVVRRVGVVVARQCLGVGADHHLSMRRVAFRWTGRAPLLPESGTLGATAFVQVHARRERRGSVAAFEASVTVRAGSREIAHGSGTVQCIDPATYRLVRGGAPRPAPVRHDSEPLSVLQQHGDRLLGRMGWDCDDPRQVDPTLDRLSGHALVAAALHAATLLRARRTVIAVSMAIDRFVEYTPRPEVYATATHRAVEVSVLQNRLVVAQGEVHLEN